MRTIYKLPETLKADLDQFKVETERFVSKAISAAEYRAFRVPQGVYEQREDGSFMLRVRLPAGLVLPNQMRALAAVARKYGNGVLHATTRQDLQVHAVPLAGIQPALLELYHAGLSTKGGGGNTVRNITACSDAGVCADEVFDVTPHAVALTEFLLPDPLNYQLPRKYKIAFSGCAKDCSGATVSDLGFIARQRGGERGFAVYVGGGLGSSARVADLLEEFVPVSGIYLVAEAVKRVFDRHGNRKNKHKARLRFLIRQIGLDRFRELYETELTRLREEVPDLPETREFPLEARGVTEATTVEPEEDFDLWRERNAVAQKQPGYYLVRVHLVLGDISADTLEELAGTVEAFREGLVRVTQSQNLVIRWVPEEELPELHRRLGAMNLATSPPPVLRELVACTGASTCKLGICLSRELARAIARKLESEDLDLEAAKELRLHINGCPNSCGRHPVASIGLVGAARRVGGRLVPHYLVKLGGKTSAGATRLAEGQQAVPARNVPEFLIDLLRAFRHSHEYPDFDDFLAAEGRKVADQLAQRHKHVPSFDDDKNYYFDWGAEQAFSLAGRGPGECSAGVFDLIEVDLASAREALSEGRLLSATELAARALLVTRGEEAKDSAQALDLFEKHFIKTGLVLDSFRTLAGKARTSLRASPAEKSFAVDTAQVSSLVETVQALYDNMDQSLRFEPQTSVAEAEPPASAPEELKVDRDADFRGVTCPLNYVKTKLLLGQMNPGQVLSVLLDDKGSRSVPESAEKDGHQVLSVTRDRDQWRVVICKKGKQVDKKGQ